MSHKIIRGTLTRYVGPQMAKSYALVQILTSARVRMVNRNVQTTELLRVSSSGVSNGSPVIPLSPKWTNPQICFVQMINISDT